jgi:two-component system phosphate regulon sensor histidine kinase PhoR
VLPTETFRSRTGFAAGVSLVLLATTSVLLLLLADRTWRIVAAAAIWVGAAVLIGWLAVRAHAKEQARQAELDEVEARYRALLDGLPLVTWLTDPGDRESTLDVSPAISELTGYSPSEWTEQPSLFSKLLHPEDRDRVLAELEGAANGVPVRVDYRLFARDGRAVWVRDETVTVRDSAGEPLYTQTFLRDLGELRRAEDRREQLRVSERAAAAEVAERQSRLDLVRRAGQELSSTLDHQAALSRVADLVVRDLADWCVIDLIDAGDLKRAVVARAEPKVGRAKLTDTPGSGVQAVAQGGQATILPRPGETAKGEPVRFLDGLEARSVISVPLVARKQPLGALTLVRTAHGEVFDADDLALVEDLAVRIGLALDRGRLYGLVEERADAARVLEHVGDGVLLLDRNGEIRLWNPAAEAITGIEAKNVLGRPAVDAIPGWQSAADQVPVLPKPDPGHDEVTIPIDTPRGERWISISGVRFFGGTVYAFRDLTDVRRLEEIKADFIATASHELRTPLAAVYGAAQTLLRHDFALDEVGRQRFVSLIAEESERLGRIVNEILLANQLDAGRVDMEFEPFDPADLVERVVEATRIHMPPTVTISHTAEGDLPRFSADPDKVRQVLVNLIENAIKYSPEGGHVEVGVTESDGAVRFGVRDEGLGIAPEDQDRIFEKFYRADPQMLRGVGGTGLGLYICKELVGRMGGRIWVEPNDGKGSAFFFELQTAEAAVVAHGTASRGRLHPVTDPRGRPGFDVVAPGSARAPDGGARSRHDRNGEPTA